MGGDLNLRMQQRKAAVNGGNDEEAFLREAARRDPRLADALEGKCPDCGTTQQASIGIAADAHHAILAVGPVWIPVENCCCGDCFTKKHQDGRREFGERCPDCPWTGVGR